jgi:hypothetical protein
MRRGMDPGGPEKQRTYSGTSRKSRTVYECEQGLPQRLKPDPIPVHNGTAKAVPFPKGVWGLCGLLKQRS